MTDFARQIARWNQAVPPLVFLVILLIPMGSILWFRHHSEQLEDPNRKSRWITLRRQIHIFLLLSVGMWWALFDFLGIRSLWLWCALVCGVAEVQLACYLFDRAFLERRWTLIDVLRLTFWRTVFPTISLLLIALGFDSVYDHRLTGVLWFVAAAIVALVGMVRLRIAEGMKLQEVKSGTAYKRAFFLAKQMKIRLKRVYVVPAGRGHMTNAFGGGQSIAVTDNYGKFLHAAELDFVIGHELGHVTERHGRKRLLVTGLLYASTALLCFFLPAAFNRFRPLLDIIVMVGPVLALYYLSRQFEYAADRFAVELTQAPETGINALASLYRITQAPSNCDGIIELFMTHPSFTHRAQAIGEAGKMPEQKVLEIIREAQGYGVVLG